MTSNPVVAIVGATGAVGQTMLQVLAEKNFPLKKLVPFASKRSAGKKIEYKGQKIEVVALEKGCFEGIDIALFSAGGSVSEKYAPQAASEGAVVVDNTAAFRYHDDIPLVVPECNRADIFKHNGIIANPNCSTIQLLVALKPLHEAFTLKRMIVSTYQAVSGAGATAIQEMLDNTKAILNGENFENKKFAHQIAFNALPQIDKFMEGGWTKEEMKMVWETHKILGDENIGVTSTCVRIPVTSGHSESVYAEFDRQIEISEVRNLWENASGIKVMDDPANSVYPLASKAVGTNPVYVGRLRKDHVCENAINFWCVADNLRKGAALNAVQIAECLVEGK